MRFLFPSHWSKLTFIAYISLFVNQGVLITLSKSHRSILNYNVPLAVLLSEIIKLTFSLVQTIYATTDDSSNKLRCVIEKFRVYHRLLLFYFVPSALYCAYNNLTFVNLSHLDPTTYYLLLQFRVVLTGILFQQIFKIKLSPTQWFSLALLTIGCIVKESGNANSESIDGIDKITKFDMNTDTSNQTTMLHSSSHVHLFLIGIQIFCSCMAGVYNEYLLKMQGSQVEVCVQNLFMYFDSVLCNLLTMFLWKSPSSNFRSVFKPIVLAVILNNAAIGIVTSYFLKQLNVILKAFASALELVFTATLAWIIFGVKIRIHTIIAIVIVSVATFLYSKDPVKTEVQQVNGERIADIKV